MTRRFLLAVALIVFLSACTFSDPPTSQPTDSDPPTPTPASDLSKQIDEGEQKWREREIAGYRIEVTEIRSTWHLQTHVIVVRDGQVVEVTATCDPAPAELGKCKVEPFDAQDYVVSALFARARKKAQSEPERTRITFDRRYGFPSGIFFDAERTVDGRPGVVDGNSAWRVEAFEVLD